MVDKLNGDDAKMILIEKLIQMQTRLRDLFIQAAHAVEDNKLELAEQSAKYALAGIKMVRDMTKQLNSKKER